MAGKDGNKNWKHGKLIPMVLRFCPTGGGMAWANPASMGCYRCTKCGQVH